MDNNEFLTRDKQPGVFAPEPYFTDSDKRFNAMSIEQQLAFIAVKKFSETGLPPSLIIERLKLGGHKLKEVAFACRQLSALDAMMFSRFWSNDESEILNAQRAFLDRP